MFGQAGATPEINSEVPAPALVMVPSAAEMQLVTSSSDSTTAANQNTQKSSRAHAKPHAQLPASYEPRSHLLGLPFIFFLSLMCHQEPNTPFSYCNRTLKEIIQTSWKKRNMPYLLGKQTKPAVLCKGCFSSLLFRFTGSCCVYGIL